MTEASVYQTVHTLGGRIFRLEEHLGIIDRAAQALFGHPFRPGTDAVARRIGEVLTREHAAADRSAFVRLVLTASGELQTLFAGNSLYRGYDLRSVAPQAVTVAYDLPLGEYPTSAREAAAALAHARARSLGAQVAVRCSMQGRVLTADDAPLFAVQGRNIYMSPVPPGIAGDTIYPPSDIAGSTARPDIAASGIAGSRVRSGNPASPVTDSAASSSAAGLSVEALLAAEAIAAAGLTLETRPILREELPEFDELFYFDHRGLTVLSRCDGVPCMDIVARRVARAAARLTPDRPAQK